LSLEALFSSSALNSSSLVYFKPCLLQALFTLSLVYFKPCLLQALLIFVILSRKRGTCFLQPPSLPFFALYFRTVLARLTAASAATVTPACDKKS
jgi:hypothetical protein